MWGCHVGSLAAKYLDMTTQSSIDNDKKKNIIIHKNRTLLHIRREIKRVRSQENIGPVCCTEAR